MSKQLKCIMLVDDNSDDNFFHEREIRKSNPEIVVIVKDNGKEALEYLRSINDLKYIHPDLILLDINMPGMNGWEFLEEYNQLNIELQSLVTIIMLTTSDNPQDLERAKTWKCISGYITKPLTNEILVEIIGKYFK